MDELKQTTTLPDKASIPEAMLLAVGWQREGRVRTAVEVYRRILSLHPDHPDALHFLGVALHQLGQSADRVKLLRRALQLMPEYVTDTLYLVKDEAKIRKYKALYRSLGIAMVVSPIAAVVVTFVLQPQRQDKSTVFFIEVFAVWTFAAYWLFKSRELKATNAQRLALDRKIET